MIIILLELCYMEDNIFNNIQYINRMFSIGKDLLKFSLLLNSEILNFFIPFFDIPNNIMVERNNSNSVNKKADYPLEPADFYF